MTRLATSASTTPQRPEGPDRPERLTEASGRTFTPRAVRWIVGVGIVSLLATLILSVLSVSKEPTQETADPNAFSYSAVGHRAYVALMQRLGIDVAVSRHRSAEKAGPERPLLVLEPTDTTAELEHLKRITQTVVEDQVPMIVALPKWAVLERNEDERWANRIELLSPYRVTDALSAVSGGLVEAEALVYLGALSIARGDSETGTVSVRGRESGWQLSLAPYQLLSEHDDLEPIITVDGVIEGPRTLLARVRGTNVYLLSDPDIVNTMGIGAGDHAAIAVALVTEVLGADEVVLDEVNHGFEKAETIWQELLGFPLLLLTLHVAGLLALALWAAMARFGKPEARPPRVPSGKQTLLDNTATLLALGHHAGYGAKRYFETTLRALSRTYGLPSEASEAARIDLLATLALRRGHKTDLRVLAREVAALADRGGARDEHRARELARRIFSFRKELTDGHRSDS